MTAPAKTSKAVMPLRYFQEMSVTAIAAAIKRKATKSTGLAKVSPYFTTTKVVPQMMVIKIRESWGSFAFHIEDSEDKLDMGDQYSGKNKKRPEDLFYSNINLSD